jgi:hypothetical protein
LQHISAWFLFISVKHHHFALRLARPAQHLRTWFMFISDKAYSAVLFFTAPLRLRKFRLSCSFTWFAFHFQ